MPTWSKNPEVKARQKAADRLIRRRRHKERMTADPGYRQRITEKKRQSIKRRRAADPVFRKRFNRRKSLQANYGISLEDYGILQLSQDNKCGICGLEPLPEDKALAVDCDHSLHPPLIRGLLCMKCNTSIGKFNHDIRLLQRAIDWLNGVR